MPERLVVHIGTGKAGSSAIQRYLRVHRNTLEQYGLHYWGLNFEHVATEPHFPWQAATGIGTFQRLTVPEARQQLRTVLAKALQQLPAEGCAVWSNESIYERPEVYAQELQLLQREKGIEMVIIGYVRNHRSYIDSAYKQWGIQHKTYPGRVQGFKEWASKNQAFLSFGAKMKAWDEMLGNCFRLFNYDRAGDVVDHFLTTLPGAATEELKGLPRPDSVNASPSRAVLALFALHNNRFDNPIPPGAFQAVLERHGVLSEAHPPLHDLASLYPDKKTLDVVEKTLANDVELVNSLLQKHGESPFGTSSQTGNNVGMSEIHATTAILSALLSMLMEQDERIQRLEKFSKASDQKQS